MQLQIKVSPGEYKENNFIFHHITARQTDISSKQFKRLLKTFLLGRRERGALWLTVKSRHLNHLTYLLTCPSSHYISANLLTQLLF